MTNGANLPPQLLTVVDAVRGAVDDARRRLERAQRLKQAITAMAVHALRQRDLGDVQIQTLLGLDADTIAAASDRREPPDRGAQDWELRAEIEQLWLAVRRQASVWVQTDDLSTSAQVIERNGIDTGSWPLAVRALDSPGAEFVHQTSGQKIVVYSLQARDGTPQIVNDAIVSWDYWGEYNVEFVSRAGARSPLDLGSFGLVSSARTFRRRSSREALMEKTFPTHKPATGRDAAESFGAIITAIRRMCGPLPPYSEAAAAMSAD